MLLRKEFLSENRVSLSQNRIGKFVNYCQITFDILLIKIYIKSYEKKHLLDFDGNPINRIDLC